MSDDFHSPPTFASRISSRAHFISLLRRLIYGSKNGEICHNDSPKSWGRVELNPMMTVWPRKIWPSFPVYLTRCQVSPASPTSINNCKDILIRLYVFRYFRHFPSHPFITSGSFSICVYGLASAVCAVLPLRSEVRG